MSARVLSDSDTAKIAASLEIVIYDGKMYGRLSRHRKDELVRNLMRLSNRQARIDEISFNLLRINTLSYNARYNLNSPIRYDVSGFPMEVEPDEKELVELLDAWLYNSDEAEFCANSEIYRLLEDWQAEIACKFTRNAR